MEQRINVKQRNIGFYTFFISGIGAISSGIVVSMLQEQIGFAYAITGTLLSLMSIGNLIAGFATGILPGFIGRKNAVLLLTAGYGVGYLAMASFSQVPILMAAFFLAGIGKGCTINTCTILVGDNSKNRIVGMNFLHSFYAFGALLCPFLIVQASRLAPRAAMVVLGVCGVSMWLAFASVDMSDGNRSKKQKTDWSFLHEQKFWLLTALLFFQNATETSVIGWLVTYFKGSGILTGTYSTYTVTVTWFATLIIRLLIAFVFPVKDAGTAMIKMGIGCTVFYAGLMCVSSQWPAIILLFAFAAAMAGMNPTAVASAGRMTSAASMGIMLPAASSGAIIMPWIIGIVAERFGIRAGMACIIIPCIGMLLVSMAVRYVENKTEFNA
ncbi:MAG: MFS transporter [Eubacteriales bacterium]|nr:MFS transporter [Eubacteriales bacterium]